MRKFTRKNPFPRWSPRPGPTLCASLRSRNASIDMSQELLYAEI